MSTPGGGQPPFAWRLSRRPAPARPPALEGLRQVVRQRRLALKTSLKQNRRQGRLWRITISSTAPPPATGDQSSAGCPGQTIIPTSPRGIMQPHHQAIVGLVAHRRLSPKRQLARRPPTNRKARNPPGRSGLAGSPGLITERSCLVAISTKKIARTIATPAEPRRSGMAWCASSHSGSSQREGARAPPGRSPWRRSNTDRAPGRRPRSLRPCLELNRAPAKAGWGAGAAQAGPPPTKQRRLRCTSLTIDPISQLAATGQCHQPTGQDDMPRTVIEHGGADHDLTLAGFRYLRFAETLR